MKIITAFIVFFTLASFSKAEEMVKESKDTKLSTIKKSPKIHDSRIQTVFYNSEKVYTLMAYFGYSIHITLLEDDSIDQIALGDPSAWEIKTRRNHVFIKPIAENPKTNLTILTNKRVYNFSIDAEWPDKDDNIIFQFKFKTIKKEIKSEPKVNMKKVLKTNYFSKKKPKNWDYWFKGAMDLKPDIVFDDGRFTFLKFSNNQEMPAVYLVDINNEESLVNTHINPLFPDVIAIHSVRDKIILRRGNYVMCIFNKSFDKSGLNTKSGTTTPFIYRALKD